MRSVIVLCVLVICGFSLLASTGCSVRKGSGVVALVMFDQGDLTTTFPRDVSTTAEIAMAAMKELGIRQVDHMGGSFDARVQGQTNNARPVVVEISRISAEECRVKIRVGVVGDEALSRNLYDTMMTRVTPAPATKGS